MSAPRGSFSVTGTVIEAVLLTRCMPPAPSIPTPPLPTLEGDTRGDRRELFKGVSSSCTVGREGAVGMPMAGAITIPSSDSTDTDRLLVEVEQEFVLKSKANPFVVQDSPFCFHLITLCVLRIQLRKS